MVYFSEYTSKQCPDKDYLFTILGVLSGEELKTLIQEARRKRSIYEEPDINEFVEVTEEIKKEIEDVFTQKSKVRVIITYLKLQGENMLYAKERCQTKGHSQTSSSIFCRFGNALTRTKYR